MKRLLIAAFAFVFGFTSNVSADGLGIKMGIILGFTGPIESLTPAMAASAELAFKEASDSGSLLNGKKITVIRADSTCVDSAAATAAAPAARRGADREVPRETRRRHPPPLLPHRRHPRRCRPAAGEGLPVPGRRTRPGGTRLPDHFHPPEEL